MTIIIPDPPEFPTPSPTFNRELEIMRRGTKAFIDADPVSLVLQRMEQTRNTRGGYEREWSPVPEGQIFRLIPQSDQTTEIKTSSGRIVSPTFVILAEWDADIQRWDHFMFDGREWELATPIRPLHTDRAYELKSDVVLYAG